MIRLRLTTILVLIHLVILALPLGGIAVLRIYESALIRQTESELLAQGAVIAATYGTLYARQKKNSTYGLIPTFQEDPAPGTGPWQPRRVRLDLALDPILPPAPEAQPGTQAADPVAVSLGREIEPILRDAQFSTLAGLRIVDYRGVIVATTGADRGRSMLGIEEARRALSGETVSLMRRRGESNPLPPLDSISRGTRIRVSVALPIVRDQRVIGAVTLLRTPANIRQAIWGKREVLAWGGALMLAIVLGLSLFTALTIGRPVQALMAQARRASRGEAGAVKALKHPGTREIAELSETVATMARTLEERAAYIRDFAAHVSHEFKTPLTSIRGTVELLRDHAEQLSPEERARFLALLETDAARLERLVRKLLELARADMAAVDPSQEPCELGPLLEALARRYRQRGLPVELESPTRPVHAAINADTLDSILATLLDNVGTHAGSGARAWIALRAADSSQKIEIEIHDDGKGISPSNAAHIFEPFFTTSRSAGSTGLGLSIARRLLQAHDGSIEQIPASRGARFRLTLPARNPGAPPDKRP